MNDMLDIMQEMLEEGFTQEQAQFIAATDALAVLHIMTIILKTTFRRNNHD